MFDLQCFNVYIYVKVKLTYIDIGVFAMKSIETCRILVIDDEPSVLRVLVLMLEKIGCKSIDTADNGEQGISRIDRNTYDLIFTDIKMPGLTGNQVLDHIKKRNHSTLIIGVSGTPWLLTDQFDAALPKPFTKSELVEILDTMDIKLPFPNPKKRSFQQENTRTNLRSSSQSQVPPAKPKVFDCLNS